MSGMVSVSQTLQSRSVSHIFWVERRAKGAKGSAVTNRLDQTQSDACFEVDVVHREQRAPWSALEPLARFK